MRAPRTTACQLQPDHLLRAAGGKAVESSISRIGKGTYHSRNILERGLLAAALDERSRRLAFKIKQNKITCFSVAFGVRVRNRAKRLTKMKISVNANLLPGWRQCGELFETMDKLFAARKHKGCRV